ncbi:MAG: hypothetical protein AUG51_21780 [Acidobacteria bacterium 13_1_20CM_3_53_8]|nr:MAG: hypothetical protein AUG51_21780 [Acidobacteria bacterium 13_1_20CM_3_53_8]
MSNPEQDDERPQRNRIVINLGQQQQAQAAPPNAPQHQPAPAYSPMPPQAQNPARVYSPTPGRSSVPKRGGGALKILAVMAALLFVIMLCIAIGGYFWWQHQKASPAYSVALLVDSVQNNNMQEFDEVVDMDKVVENFVPQIVDAASKRYGVTANDAIRSQVEAAIPRLLPAVKQYVSDEVARQAKEISARAGGYPFFLVALAVPYMAQITEEGDTAKAVVQYQDRTIELTMQRASEERWRVIKISDDTLTARIVERLARDLPGTASQIEDAIRQHTGNNLPGSLQELLNGGNENGNRRKGRSR